MDPEEKTKLIAAYREARRHLRNLVARQRRMSDKALDLNYEIGQTYMEALELHLILLRSQ